MNLSYGHVVTCTRHVQLNYNNSSVYLNSDSKTDKAPPQEPPVNLQLDQEELPAEQREELPAGQREELPAGQREEQSMLSDQSISDSEEVASIILQNLFNHVMLLFNDILPDDAKDKDGARLFAVLLREYLMFCDTTLSVDPLSSCVTLYDLMF